MIYKSKPRNFLPKFEVVSCYCEKNGEILMLHRLAHKSQGDRWGVPAGKINADEKKDEAILREIYEETGLKALVEDLSYIDTLYVKHEDYQFTYYMYYLPISQTATVIINPTEHSAFQWVKPKKALDMNLVEDLDYCIKLYHKNT